MDDEVLLKYKDEIERFNEWILKESRLPKNINPILLLRFLKVCDFDHDKARELIKLNYEFRSKHPQLFANRDMNSNEIQNVIHNIQIYPLAKPTKKNYRVTMSRWIDDDVNKFDVENTIKWLFMISDSGLVDSSDIADGEVTLTDFKGFTWSHFLKVAGNLSSIRTFLNFVQETVPYKLIENHYVNCSPIVTKLMILIKPFIKKELYNAMHFHTSDFESLYEYIPKEILPAEYGGTEGPIEDFHKQCLSLVKKHHKYICDENNFKISD